MWGIDGRWGRVEFGGIHVNVQDIVHGNIGNIGKFLGYRAIRGIEGIGQC